MPTRDVDVWEHSTLLSCAGVVVSCGAGKGNDMKRLAANLLAVFVFVQGVNGEGWTDRKSWYDEGGLRWDYYIIGGNAVIVGCYDKSKINSNDTLYVPNYLNGRTVVDIGQTFNGWDNLKYVHLPLYLTNIVSYAFNGCTSIGHIEIPDSVLSIEDEAFHGCSKLSDVKMHVGLKEIGARAFNGCSKLGEVTIPSSVEKIGTPAFYGCQSLASINVDFDSEDYQGPFFYRSNYGVLYDWEITKLIRCPEGMLSVGGWFPVQEICAQAFYNCSKIESISIGVAIGDFAFYGCTSLSKLTLRDGVTRIGKSAFSGCINLSALEVPGTVANIDDSAFYGCGLNRLTLKSGVESVGDCTFKNCFALAVVDIPKSLIQLGTQAFPYASIGAVNVETGDASRVKSLLEESGVNVSNIDFVDPMFPKLNPSADASDVRAALEGSADARLSENILDAASYGEYREWAMKVAPAEVKASPFAWASFATDSAALLTKMPVDDDLKIEEFTPSTTVGSFDFTVSVKDVTIGDNANKDNLQKLFGLEGAEMLESSAFSSENVMLDFKDPQEGKLKFVATPVIDNAKSFFMKMKVK